MTDYRGFQIVQDVDRHNNPVTIIVSPDGDEWQTVNNPEQEIDQILEWRETLEETHERNYEWGRGQRELI